MISRLEFYITLVVISIFFTWFYIETTKIIRSDITHCKKYNELELRAILNVVMKIQSEMRQE